MLLQLLFCVLVAANKCIFVNSVQNKIQVDHFLTPCPGTTNLPIIYEDIKRLFTEDGTFIVNLNLRIRKEIPHKIAMTISANRCKSKENLNTCTNFNTFRSNNFCEAAVAKNEFWSPFMNCFKPLVHCPLKKKLHVGTNCTFDVSKFHMLSMDGSYWKIKLEYFDVITKEPLCCTQLGVSLY